VVYEGPSLAKRLRFLGYRCIEPKKSLQIGHGAYRDRTDDLRLAKRLGGDISCRVVPPNNWKGLLLRISDHWCPAREGTGLQASACGALAAEDLSRTPLSTARQQPAHPEHFL
jgi:hypothetical protein